VSHLGYVLLNKKYHGEKPRYFFVSHAKCGIVSFFLSKISKHH